MFCHSALSRILLRINTYLMRWISRKVQTTTCVHQSQEVLGRHHREVTALPVALAGL